MKGSLNLALAIWSFTALFASADDVFQNRPLPAELDDIVALGTELMRGVNERCWATQYKMDPAACRINPPFVRTNAAGWPMDQKFFHTADVYTKNLVSYYLETNSGVTNVPVFMTVTGLFSRLGVGNKTNDFTPVTSWTNSGRTNFWIYAYREAFKERYKVLRSLKCTADLSPPAMIRSSRREIAGGIGDLEIISYENKQDKRVVRGYAPDFEAEILGYAPNRHYATNRAVWKSLGQEVEHVPISFKQVKHIFEAIWYKGFNEKPPPWINTNSPLIINTTNEPGNFNAAGMGTFLFCHPGNFGAKSAVTYDSGHVGRESKGPTYTTYSSGKGPGGGGGGGGGGVVVSGSPASDRSAAEKATIAKKSEKIHGWTWRGKVSAIYGTYVWTNFCIPTSIVCQVAVMCQPQTMGKFSMFGWDLIEYTLPQNMTQRVEGIGWRHPRKWQITLNNRRFEESSGMTTSKYCVIPLRYLRINTDGANTLSLIIGSDQLVPLAQPGSIPDWCDEPLKNWDYTSNIGSIGKALSIWFDRNKIYLKKTWSFQSCTNTF